MTDQDPQEELPSTGSTPTDAHLAMNALLVRTLLEVAHRRQDELPGLSESCQDSMLLLVGPTSRAVHGWFAEKVWRLGEQRVHELFLNGDRRGDREASVSSAEDVLTTLLHEGCHLYAQVNGIKDNTRGGRYHNRRFAEIALQIGLEVVKDPSIGHRTPRLSVWARAEYADLLAELERGLVLNRESQFRQRRPANSGDDGEDGGNADGSSTRGPKYVFAACRCEVGRGRRVTIRVAAGYWPRRIVCRDCGSDFEES